MHRRDVLALAGTTLLTRLVRAAPDRDVVVPDVEGKWEEMKLNPSFEKNYVRDHRERDAFIANVRTFHTIMRDLPVWAKPKGFDVHSELSWGTNGDHEEPPAPIAAHLLFQVLWYVRDAKGGVVRQGEAPLHMFVTFNQPDSVFNWQYEQLSRDKEGSMFKEPIATKTKSGVPRLNGWHVLTKRTQPLFLPVSRKRLVASWLAEARKEPSKQQIARLEGLLANLTDPDAAAYATGYRELGVPGDPKSRAVASANRNFLDPKLPRTAVQLALVGSASLGWDAPELRDMAAALERQSWAKLLDTLV